MPISLDDVQRGYDAWAAKPHNAKWVRKIDGTPIANDVVVNIFEALKESSATAAEATVTALQEALEKIVDHVPPLDDKTITDLAWKHFGESVFILITREKSPPMIPQETYDVPTLALRQFVDAIRAVPQSLAPMAVPPEQGETE